MWSTIQVKIRSVISNQLSEADLNFWLPLNCATQSPITNESYLKVLQETLLWEKGKGMFN